LGDIVEEEVFALEPGGEIANGDAPRSFSSNPSPERIDEKVGGESPLVDEHTGSGEIRYSA
jgi:hypothetical protein